MRGAARQKLASWRRTWTTFGAVWLMLLQTLLAAEHLSAMAAAGAGPAGIGFLSICRVSLDEAGDPIAPPGLPGGTDEHDCALCSAVASAGAAIQVAAPVLPIAAPAPLVVVLAASIERARGAPFHHLGAPRGPPALHRT